MLLSCYILATPLWTGCGLAWTSLSSLNKHVFPSYITKLPRVLQSSQVTTSGWVSLGSQGTAGISLPVLITDVTSAHKLPCRDSFRFLLLSLALITWHSINTGVRKTRIKGGKKDKYIYCRWTSICSVEIERLKEPTESQSPTSQKLLNHIQCRVSSCQNSAPR